MAQTGPKHKGVIFNSLVKERLCFALSPFFPTGLKYIMSRVSGRGTNMSVPVDFMGQCLI